MARSALYVAATCLTAVTSPLTAQRPASAPTYFAAVLTPTGALPPLVTPAMFGRPSLGLGLDLRYGYARLSRAQPLPVHTVAANFDLALLGGHLSLSATGAYLLPDCGAAMHCDGYPMGGAGVTLRVANWAVDDGVSPGRATLALHGEGGVGLPRGGTARSASAGLAVTLIGEHGTLRVAAFGLPQVVWGRLRITDPAAFDRQFGSVFSLGDETLDARDVRFVAGGGLAVLGTRSGLGLHLGVQQVVVHGARPRVGVGISWRTP
jgi:hypothetical protein